MSCVSPAAAVPGEVCVKVRPLSVLATRRSVADTAMRPYVHGVRPTNESVSPVMVDVPPWRTEPAVECACHPNDLAGYGTAGLGDATQRRPRPSGWPAVSPRPGTQRRDHTPLMAVPNDTGAAHGAVTGPESVAESMTVPESTPTVPESLTVPESISVPNRRPCRSPSLSPESVTVPESPEAASASTPPESAGGPAPVSLPVSTGESMVVASGVSGIRHWRVSASNT